MSYWHVGVVVIAIGAGGLGFDYQVGRIGHSVANGSCAARQRHSVANGSCAARQRHSVANGSCAARQRHSVANGSCAARQRHSVANGSCAARQRHSVANGSPPLRCFFGAVLSRHEAVEIDSATRYTFRGVGLIPRV